jgi:hypothetical protein
VCVCVCVCAEATMRVVLCCFCLGVYDRPFPFTSLLSSTRTYERGEVDSEEDSEQDNEEDNEDGGRGQ